MEKETIKIGSTMFRLDEIEHDVAKYNKAGKRLHFMFSPRTVQGLCERIRRLEKQVEEMRVPSIKDKAEKALFFVDVDDIWYKMCTCGENEFQCEDEETGEVYTIPYNTVEPTCRFYKMQIL